MPRKLIVCADGTWNTENNTNEGMPCPTNVTRLRRALLPLDGRSVAPMFHDLTVVERFRQGAAGSCPPSFRQELERRTV